MMGIINIYVRQLITEYSTIIASKIPDLATQTKISQYVTLGDFF